MKYTGRILIAVLLAVFILVWTAPSGASGYYYRPGYGNYYSRGYRLPGLYGDLGRHLFKPGYRFYNRGYYFRPRNFMQHKFFLPKPLYFDYGYRSPFDIHHFCFGSRLHFGVSFNSAR